MKTQSPAANVNLTVFMIMLSVGDNSATQIVFVGESPRKAEKPCPYPVLVLPSMVSTSISFASICHG